MDYKKTKNLDDVKLNKNNFGTQKKEGVAHKIGDKIEKVGDLVSEKVSKKAGSAISNLGDKIEHSQD